MSLLVETLGYKMESRGFESRRGYSDLFAELVLASKRNET